MSTFDRSNIHIPMYACLSRVNTSLILCTASRSLVNSLRLTYVGLATINFLSSVTSCTSTRFRRFSMVLPNTLLFMIMSLKKSFSKLFLAPMCILSLSLCISFCSNHLNPPVGRYLDISHPYKLLASHTSDTFWVCFYRNFSCVYCSLIHICW